MKSKMRIKSIIVMAIIVLAGMFFINMSLAATTGKINVETANLRETANAESKILSQLSLNQEVEIIEKSGEWYQVRYNGITGFIRQDLITANGEVSTNENQVQNVTVNEQQESPEGTTEQEQSQENSTAETNQSQEGQTTETEQNSEQQDTNLGKYRVSKDVKLKIIPSINATDTIDVKQNEEVNVIEVINGWACVEVQNTKGWIRQENLQKEEQQSNQQENPETNQQTEVPEIKTVIKTQYVNSATVNLRRESNTSSEILTSLSLNTAVEILSESSGWSNVRVAGLEGYISTELLKELQDEDFEKNYKIRIDAQIGVALNGNKISSNKDFEKVTVIKDVPNYDLGIIAPFGITSYVFSNSDENYKNRYVFKIPNETNNSKSNEELKLYMIGFNRGPNLALTNEGIKAQITQGNISQNTDSIKIMYSIPALQGSSGSPVVNQYGELVAVNFAGISTTQGFNYGIKAERLKEILNDTGIQERINAVNRQE